MSERPLQPDHEIQIGGTTLATLHVDGAITLKNGRRLIGESFQHAFKKGGHFSVKSDRGQTRVELVRPGRPTERYAFRGICWFAESASPDEAQRSDVFVEQHGSSSAGDPRIFNLNSTALFVAFGVVAACGLYLGWQSLGKLTVADGGSDLQGEIETAARPGTRFGLQASEVPNSIVELGDSFSQIGETIGRNSKAAGEYGRVHQALSQQIIRLTPGQEQQVNDYLDRLEQYLIHVLAYSGTLSDKSTSLLGIETEIESSFRGTDRTSLRQKEIYRELVRWKPDRDQSALLGAVGVRDEDVNTGKPLMVEAARRKLLHQTLTLGDMLDHLVAIRCLQVELKQWCHVEELLVEFLPRLPAELVLRAETDLSPPASGDAKVVYPTPLKQDARLLEQLLGDRAEPFRIPWDISAVEKWLDDYADLPQGYAGLSGRAVLHPNGRIEHQSSQTALDGAWERLSGDARRRSRRNPDHDIVQLREQIARKLEADLGPAPATSPSRSHLDLSPPPASNSELQAEVRIISLLLEKWHADLPKGDDRFYAEMRDEYDSLTMRLNDLYAQANARDAREETLDGIRRDQQRLSGQTPERRSRSTTQRQGVPTLSGYNPLAEDFAKMDENIQLSADDLNAERRLLLQMFEKWDSNLRSGRADTYYEFKDRQKAKLQERYREINAQLRTHLNPFNR